MSTPINDSSGMGFFGAGHWGERVFWYNVPAKWRERDSSNYLRYMLKTWGDAGEKLLTDIASMPLQRDPYLVRTSNSIVKWFYVTEAFSYDDEERGKVVRLVGEKNISNLPDRDTNNPPSDDEDVLASQFPWYPYTPLSDVGRGWELKWNNTKYDVVNVRSRNLDQIYDADNSLANEVWVQGGDLVLFFDYFTNRQWHLDIGSSPEQGTIVAGYTDGSQCPVVELPILPCRLLSRETPASMNIEDATIIVRIPLQGGGYRYLYDVPDPLDNRIGSLNSASGTTITSTEGGTVNYLSGDIQINLDALSEFSNKTRSEIKVRYIVRGYFMRFNVPALIGYLGKDFALEVDQYDPEDVQRSSVANVSKFWGLKGAADAYRIRGEVSLFDVNMIGLYRLSSPAVAAKLPTDHVYEIGTSLYTDIQPIYIRYDHISGDELFYDFDSDTWEPVTDNMLVAEDDGRWDGVTIGQAYALDVTQGYYAAISEFDATVRGPATIASVTPLDTDELSLLRWQNGYKYEISMLRCQKKAFNFHEGYFALSKYTYNANPVLGMPPSLDDTTYDISSEMMIDWTPDPPWTSGDPEATTDIGTWTVLVQFGAGVASPLEVDDDVAVRYLPRFDLMVCDYCRTSSMRGVIDVTDEATEYYDSYDKIELAIARVKNKLLHICPEHARVIEWEVTRQFSNEMYGVTNGADVQHSLSGIEFVGNIAILLTVQFRGDADAAGKEIDFSVVSDGTGTVWSESNWFHASANSDTWINVTTEKLILLPSAELPLIAVKLNAVASATVTHGDVRFTFKVTTLE